VICNENYIYVFDLCYHSNDQKVGSFEICVEIQQDRYTLRTTSVHDTE